MTPLVYAEGNCRDKRVGHQLEMANALQGLLKARGPALAVVPGQSPLAMTRAWLDDGMGSHTHVALSGRRQHRLIERQRGGY